MTANMYIVGVKTLSGIATAAIAVIACAVLGAVTVLPATLRLLGPRIDRGRIPLMPRAHTDTGGGFWSALVERVTRRCPTGTTTRARSPGCGRATRNPLWRTVGEWLESDWPFGTVEYAPRP
jgi:hypothetical protein